MGQPDWPPEWPPRSATAGCDEHGLAELVDELALDRRGWQALCAEAKNLVESPAIEQLASMIEISWHRAMFSTKPSWRSSTTLSARRAASFGPSSTRRRAS
jgi:hypothetical protein